MCPADRLALDRNGRLAYDGYRNVPRLGHYVGHVDLSSAATALAAIDRPDGATERARVDGSDDERTSLTVSRRGTERSAIVDDAAISAEASRALDDVRARTRLVAASWEDAYLGYYARDGAPETLDVLTIADSSPGRPIAYSRSSRVDPCVPRGLSDRMVGRGPLVRVGTSVRYEPERSEFDPGARPVAVRLVPAGLALRGDARERVYLRLSQAAYLARLDRFQASVDAHHDAQCTTP